MLSVQSATSSSFLGIDDSFGNIMDFPQEEFSSPFSMEDLLSGGGGANVDRSADDQYPSVDNDALDESMAAVSLPCVDLVC